MKKEKSFTGIEAAVILFFLCLTVFSLYWKVQTGFDTDEQYAIVTAGRFLRGDRYMLDIFDAYQFSGLFESVFWALSLRWFADNPVIGYRLISIAVSMLAGLPVLHRLYRRSESLALAVMGYLVWVTALPKSILSLEHAGIAKILITYLILLGDEWVNARPHPVLAGIVFSLLALAYPTMVVLAVPVFLYQTIKKQYREAGVLAAVCVLIAAVVFAPVAARAGITGLFQSIRMIGMDESHTVSAAGKLGLLKEDGMEFLRYGLRMLEYGAAACAGYFLARYVFRRAKPDMAAGIIVMCAVPFLHIVMKLAMQRWTPLYLYDRYLLVLLVTAAAAAVRKDKGGTAASVLLALIWIVGFVTTNNGFYSPDGLIIPAVLVFAAVMGDKQRQRLVQGFLAAVLLSQCACMVLTARLTSTMANTVFAEYFRSYKGLPGLRIEPESADFFTFAEYCTPLMESDNLVVSGYDGYAYIITGKNVVAPVTMSTVVYGKQWDCYYSARMPENLNVLAENDDFESGELLRILEQWYTKKTVVSRHGYQLYYLERQ